MIFWDGIVLLLYKISDKIFFEEHMDTKIRVYGTRWCGDTRYARSLLDSFNLEYEFIDIDESDEGERIVKKINHGNRSVPTIIFKDGSVLVEPDEELLKRKLVAIQKD